MIRDVRTMKSAIIVTYPDGSVVKEPVDVIWDPALRLLEFRPTGDNPLRGYMFGLVDHVIESVKVSENVIRVDR
jgi:hypothetical protein